MEHQHYETQTNIHPTKLSRNNSLWGEIHRKYEIFKNGRKEVPEIIATPT